MKIKGLIITWLIIFTSIAGFLSAKIVNYSKNNSEDNVVCRVWLVPVDTSKEANKFILSGTLLGENESIYFMDFSKNPNIDFTKFEENPRMFVDKEVCVRLLK